MQNDHKLEEEVNTSKRFSSLRNVLLGKDSPTVSFRRIFTGGVIGVIVGFVESGIIPKSKQQWTFLLLFLGLRLLTGVTYSLFRWQIPFLLKGILVSLFYTIPLLLLTKPTNYPRLLLLGILSGFIISYGIERFTHKK